MDQLKDCVTELLWSVAVEEAQLFQQLKLIKDFYLIGRGDLYLEFIKLTGHILNKTPTSHSSRDVNLAFQMAMRKMHLNDETAMDSFTFMVPMAENLVSQQDSKVNKEGEIQREGNRQITLETSRIPEKEHQDPIGNLIVLVHSLMNEFVRLSRKVFVSFTNLYCPENPIFIKSSRALVEERSLLNVP